MTYSLGHIRLSTEATVEADSVVLSHGLDTLSTSDIGVCRVGQQGRNEGSHVHIGDVAGIVGAVQDMVLQKVGDKAGVTADHAGNRFILEKLLEGIIAGCQDGDIAQTVEVPKKVGWDKAYEGQYRKYQDIAATYQQAKREYRSQMK